MLYLVSSVLTVVWQYTDQTRVLVVYSLMFSCFLMLYLMSMEKVSMMTFSGSRRPLYFGGEPYYTVPPYCIIYFIACTVMPCCHMEATAMY